MSSGDVVRGAEQSNGSLTDVPKKNKVDKKKERKKKQKENRQQRRIVNVGKKATGSIQTSNQSDDDIVIEYVPAPIEIPELEDENDAEFDEEIRGLGLGAISGLGFSLSKPEKKNPYEDYKKIFEHFVAPTETEEEGEEDQPQEVREERSKADQKATTSDAQQEEDDALKGKLSKKQRKMDNQLKIAELKQLCEKPEVVEVWDVTAPDPQLLVFLKAYRNSVPVPRHWSQKRKYLQGKRGIEKPPFKLPDFIEATGISEVRQAYQDKEEAKKLKQKQRERMQPRMGKMDINYQILHDAFFKHQTKPKMNSLGDLYYEGKEYEAHIDNVKPGVLSEDLRRALGMSDNAPPPWLINMQRYGPPPSYPNLKVPGLNAPIPPGSSFGYHPGGWGKPPVDEDGTPLYGDVFGQNHDMIDSDDEVDRARRWGEMEEEEEVEEEEEEADQEEEDEMNEADFADGSASGIISGTGSGLVSGITSSLPSGIETPEMVNLRKASESVEARPLYTVLEQRAVPIGQGLMGSDHVYVMPGQDKKDKRRPDVLKNIPNDVDVTLNPEELEGLDEAQIKQLYEDRVAEQRAATRREDFSDLVAAKAVQQKRKMAQTKADKGGGAKKPKGDTFKF